ncbi:MAG: hypothetical protein HYY06_26555 [Deltaproteobacteria bacterium]|nr:hypothetical protein [Deltaproteobacteria bacterium]
MRPIVLAVFLVACGGAIRGGPARGPGGAAMLEGTVTYERRLATERGLTLSTQTLPARRVVVEAIDRRGAVVASAATDDRGRFQLRLGTTEPVTARALSISSADGFDVRVVRAPGDRRAHAVDVGGVVPGGQPIRLHAGLGGEEPGGAFHVLDRFLDGYRAVRSSLGVTLPPLIGLWRRGNDGSEAHTSFFRGESATVPGAFELQLMGGELGREDASDSDHFDSGIILHELGHFVSRVVGADASIAGEHDRQRSMVPGVAFEEAFATFFACAVLDDPLYVDTVGVEPAGSARMREHMEDAGTDRMRGVGAEATTFELLWDLADGSGGLADRDGDGVAIGFDGVMRVIQSFERSGDDYPYIGSFLVRARELGLVGDAQIVRLLKHPRDQVLSWPLAGADVWPTDLGLPASIEGKVDGVTDPQPSGGAPDPHNGFDAVQTYRIQLPKAMRMSAILRIAGSGRAADREDLDLELYDVNTDEIASAATEGHEERIDRLLGAGTYVLYVRDGGSGNRASYRLDVAAR